MKTYAFKVLLVLALLPVSCSKSTPNDIETDAQSRVTDDVDMLVFVRKGSSHTAEAWKNNKENVLVPVERQPSFLGLTNPSMTSVGSESIAFFGSQNACEGNLVLYSVEKDEQTEHLVVEGSGFCDWEITAMTHTASEVYLAYELPLVNKETSYFVRRVSLTGPNPQFVDIPLAKRAVDLEAVGEKLFILDFDAEVTDENGLVIMDLNQNEILHEMNLGYHAGSMLRDANGHIVIAYPELHTLINSTTLAVSHTQYDEETAPNFFDSPLHIFNALGQMHYVRTTKNAATEHIAATYDFGKNLTTLYYFENLLTKPQLDIEVNIKRITSMGHDRSANVLYIGYQKTATPEKGGILRLSLDSTTGYLDNTNIDGVPVVLYVN